MANADGVKVGEVSIQEAADLMEGSQSLQTERIAGFTVSHLEDGTKLVQGACGSFLHIK